MKKKLDRTTLKTSRLLDYCSEKSLALETGHERHEWPLVILKELFDNALDACEDVGTAPAVTVTLDRRGITVTGNGPGIPVETVAGVLDFSSRVSSREHYASPTRGAQGNALKTVVAIPFVLDGSAGHVEIVAKGTRHAITLKADRIRQEPVIGHSQDATKREKTELSSPYSGRIQLAQFSTVRSHVFYKSLTTTPS